MRDDVLLSLQDGFQDYILGRSRDVIARVESTPTLSAERRLDIYHNAYRARLVELLADTYERLVLYIGNHPFDTAAHAYIETHPSTARNLRDYGARGGGFPAFLAARFPDDPEVAELAEMDGRLRNTFDAPDAEALRLSDIAAVQPEAWDAMVFVLHPTVSFQSFNWNTPAIWQSLNEETAPPAAERLPQPATWLFWRKELQPHFRSLPDAECTALRAIGEGQAFGQICAMLASQNPERDIASRVGAWLRSWLEEGVLRA